MTVYEEGITHYCYCLKAEMSYDPEDIWADIQAQDGYLSIGVGGEVYFWVRRDQRVFFVLKYPELQRARQKDML